MGEMSKEYLELVKQAQASADAAEEAANDGELIIPTNPVEALNSLENPINRDYERVINNRKGKYMPPIRAERV